MFTQCVECGSTFEVTADQIAIAYGRLRCGVCGSVFVALEMLSDELDDSGDVPTCFHSERPPTVTVPDAEESPIDDLFLSQEPDYQNPPIDFDSLDESELVSVGGGNEPVVFMTHRSRPAWIGTMMWSLACLLGLVAIAIQLAWFDGNQLASRPALRPALIKTCEWLGCRIDYPSDIEQIALLSRNIEPHPSVEGALIISATMVNESGQILNFPVIEIVLSDFNGTRVAMRRFRPEEYLDDPARVDAGLPADILLPLVFEVVDPGNNAVAFEFSFL